MLLVIFADSDGKVEQKYLCKILRKGLLRKGRGKCLEGT